MTEPITPEPVENDLPHPECAGDDGKWIFESIFAALKNKTVAAAA